MLHHAQVLGSCRPWIENLMLCAVVTLEALQVHQQQPAGTRPRRPALHPPEVTHGEPGPRPIVPSESQLPLPFAAL